jgi:hypothetical protein
MGSQMVVARSAEGLTSIAAKSNSITAIENLI